MRAAMAGIAVALLALSACKPAEDPFRKLDGVWHYHDQPIAAADAATFRALDRHYAKDAARVYHGDTFRDGREYFTVKHARIRIVEGADPATIRVLKHGYAKDRAAAYFEGARFPVRDVEGFELLDYGFARDRVRGYWHRAELPDSDGPSLVPLDLHHAKDRSRVYYATDDTGGGAYRAVVKTKVIEGADPATFVRLDASYTKDAVRVWHDGTPVAGAHAESFQTLPPATEGADAEDRQNRYREGRRVGAAQR
jgi:hypothetical protein